MRIAAVGDLHFTPQGYARIRDQFVRLRDEADVLVLTGDLTNFGAPAEMEALLNALVHMRLPIIAVLGNHDYEGGQTAELIQMMMSANIKVLDGTFYHRNNVGFAGTKGFGGGFGRGVLTPLGEPEVKAFVQAGLDEVLKLESALSRIEAEKSVTVLHYAPIVDTVRGESPEIYPFLGTSRLAEVIDRHGADLVLHSHAHHGSPEGRTMGGAPVYNVALPVLQSLKPPLVYRLLDIEVEAPTEESPADHPIPLR